MSRSVVRDSKYRHVFGKAAPKEGWYEGPAPFTLWPTCTCHMVLTCTLSHLTGEMKTTVVVRHVSLSARHSTVHSTCPALPAFTTLTPACTSCAAARKHRETRQRTHRRARQPQRAINT